MENNKGKEKPSENNKNKLKPIENITVLKEWEVFPKNKTEKNPYRQISFDMGDENYTLTYVDTSIENVGKRFEVSLYLTDSKEQAYFYYLNETPYEDDRLEEKEWLFVNPEYLSEEMWESLTCNEELKDFFLKKDYCELFPEQYGKPLPELPMDDKNIPDVELIVNNSFHYHKHNTAEDTLPQPIVFKNYKDVECDSHGKEEKRALYLKPDFLSPASQVFLAEFIVNRQEENSNFIVKTNSPFFIRAVEARSMETGTENKVEYFKCDEKECHNITGNLQEYYTEISLLFEGLINRGKR